jgi:hypothetical protein
MGMFCAPPERHRMPLANGDCTHELPDRSLFLEPEIDDFVMTITAAEAMVRHIGRYQLA